ncbi:MAG: signal peptidase I [Pseudomonadota bacterium]
MSLNLALILTLLTAVSGAVLALNRWFWKEPREIHGKPSGRQTLVEYSRSFFPVLLFVLVVRSFLFEPFRIPSGSMMPTLLKGDFIFVQKFAYGLRLPVLETKFIETGSPERGDVVVFRLPSDPSVNFIKRVVGLPGDTVVYEQHRLTINGELVPLSDSGDPLEARYSELLGDKRHDILIVNPRNTEKDGTYRIPEGHYFVLGDNRDNSRDSRFISAIPETHLVGKAVRIWLHVDGWNWPRWDRIGEPIE